MTVRNRSFIDNDGPGVNPWGEVVRPQESLELISGSSLRRGTLLEHDFKVRLAIRGLIDGHCNDAEKYEPLQVRLPFTSSCRARDVMDGWRHLKVSRRG